MAVQFKIRNGIVAVLLISTIIGIQWVVQSDAVSMNKPEFDLYYVPNPEYVKIIPEGFSDLIADIYWIKTILYFGRRTSGYDFPMISAQLTGEGKETPEFVAWKKNAEKRYKYLANLVNLVIELDSHFLTPYLFGGLMIPMKAGDPDTGIEILKKGEKVFPDRWQIPYLLGYNYYFFKDDSTNAVENFMRASEHPECPPDVRSLAVGIILNTGKRGTAIGFVQNLYDRTEDPKLKEELKRVLEELQISSSETPQSGKKGQLESGIVNKEGKIRINNM